MPMRGIRGATSVKEDLPSEIISATKELLEAILKANPSLDPVDVASCLFTATPDLVSEYPAKAARELGWADVPLMCAQEIPVPNGLERCVRVLIHWNTSLSQSEIQHVYLGKTKYLRPDIVAQQR